MKGVWGAALPGTDRPPRIAMACVGIGLVQRGYERLFSDLFQLMQDDFDLTLFKGGGPRRENEKVLHFTHRNGRLVKLLPVHKLFGRTPYHTECMTFALAMLPHLRNGAFDIVHTIDPPLTRLLYRFRARLGLRFKLLYTEGATMPPSNYPPADYTHEISKVPFDESIAYGHAAETTRLLPPGVYPERFPSPPDRTELRRTYGIADDTFVILGVGAINRDHKRVDYIIDEVANLDGNVLLLLDGSMDHGDPGLIDYAWQRLGERCRISHVASEKIGELYHLADVMVHAAPYEAFGLAMVEASACGLPVITHNAPHFQWLFPKPACWIDMLRPGALAAKLALMISDPAEYAAARCFEITLQRFSWHQLRSSYADLYRHVAAMTLQPAPEADCRKAAA